MNSMKRFKLKDTHPDAKKLEEVCELMDKYKIVFYPSRGGDSYVEIGDKEYSILDSNDNRPIESFPPFTEYKLTFEKP